MPLIYGHRGARGERPENTIEAFIHATAAGVNGIETDIALTADLIPVIHHDPETQDGRLIRNLTRADIPQIPTLTQALAALPTQTWLLEIKTFPLTPGKSHPPATMVRQILKALDETAIDPVNIAIKAFDWEVLREVAGKRPTLRRICLTAPGTEAEPDIWWGLTAPSTAQAVAATGAKTWSAFHQTLSAAHIAEARALGLTVLAWTVNDKADFTRLSPLVDGIITDYPSKFTNPIPRQHYTPKN